MNKFETIINNVIEELSTSVSLNPEQIKKDLERLPQQTKDVLQKIASPLDSGTEQDPNEDIMKSLENLDFEKLPTDQKEKLIGILTSKGLLKPQENQNSQVQTQVQNQQNNSTSYGTSYGV
jgi:hypothetical protein